MIKYGAIFLALLAVLLFSGYVIFNKTNTTLHTPTTGISQQPIETTTPTPSPKIVSLESPPVRKVLSNTYHVYQTFNNCGPAALSMALSYYDIQVSQKILGDELRPYQVTGGDNDDKSVTLSELAIQSKKYSLTPYHRPNGSVELIKLFITYDIPVITRTWLHVNDDIGHYRVIKGYDSITDKIIQDDSLQGPNLSFSSNDFNSMWKKFNYEFLVMVPQDKQTIAEQILGKEQDEQNSWKSAAEQARLQYEEDPSDIYAHFNRSVALYHIGKYQESIEEFEQVQNKLTFRHLWYQIEPILAYYETGNYDKVLSISDTILNNQNRAFSELHIVRGKSYQKMGDPNKAKQEFEKAVYYNKNLSEAQVALQSIE